MAALVIVLFADRNRQRQPIFFWRQWACGVRRDRARRIISAVKVEHDRAVCCRLSVEKASTRIGVGLASEITENEKQTRLGILAQICQPNLLTIELEHGRAGYGRWRDITKYVRNIHRSVTFRGFPLRDHSIIQIQRKKIRSTIIAYGLTFEIFQPNSHPLAAHNQVETQAAHLHDGDILGSIGFHLPARDWPARHCGLHSGGKSYAYIFALQDEPSSVTRSLGENDDVVFVGTETVLARLQPEQPCQRQPLLLPVLHKFRFPLVERLLISRGYTGRCCCVSTYGGYGCESRNGQDVGRQANQSLRHTFPLYSATSGNGSSPRPEKICSNSFTSAGCTSLLDAKVSRLLSWNGPPCMSVTSPPASCTISTPAAVSHG